MRSSVATLKVDRGALPPLPVRPFGFFQHGNRRKNPTRSSASLDGNNNNAHATLGLDQGDPSLTEEEVRLAYRTAVKLVHPDLGGRDPAEVARREKLTLALNEAYVAVLQDLQLPLGSRQREPVVLDVFDRCEGEPDYGFVNPLEVDVGHVYWSKLQELFVDECRSDPLAFEELMRREGVRVNGDTVVRWVTAEQYDALSRVVEALEFENDATHVEAQAFWILDCLRRARKTNLI